MSSTRKRLLVSLAATIAGYRKGIPPRTPELIDAWLQQFPDETREPLLDALNHVFHKTYISKDAFIAFLTGLVSSDKLAPGRQPKSYWKTVNFLNIQRGGRSQLEILALFDELMARTHGLGVSDTGSKDGDFVYLDDCIGTGSRVRTDLCAWLEGAAPVDSTVHIITPVLYAGSYWIDERITETATVNGKKINLKKWRLDAFHMENRRAYRNSSDVLWPTELPPDPDVGAYTKSLEAAGYPPVLRTPGNAGTSGIYKDDAQKILLEQAFLVRGCEIRRECTNLRETARPLGYQKLEALGFGSMFVTYRNCPNNCPLALWVQQEDYPALFPRKTNTQSAVQGRPEGR
ncbi:MAG: hypothetical protein ACKVS9_15055 [Phycisphaerae bacterium]